MFGTDGGIPLHHPQRLPTALLPDRFEINAAHDALASPVMAPIVNMEVLDTGTVASCLVRPADGATPRQPVLSWIGIRPTEAVQECAPLGRRARAHPQLVQTC